MTSIRKADVSTQTDCLKVLPPLHGCHCAFSTFVRCLLLSNIQNRRPSHSIDNGSVANLSEASCHQAELLSDLLIKETMHQRLDQTYSIRLLLIKWLLRWTRGGSIDLVFVRGTLYDRTYGCCWKEIEGSIDIFLLPHNSAAVNAGQSIRFSAGAPTSLFFTHLTYSFPVMSDSFDNPTWNAECESTKVFKDYILILWRFFPVNALKVRKRFF